MHKEILSISWLNGQFRFLNAREEKTVATWECEGRVEALGTPALDLPAILREAVKQTGYGGTGAVMVLQHPRLTQQLIETPPAETKDQVMYIGRLVKQAKVSEEEVAWSWQPTQPIKSSKGLVLYLFPQRLQERLIEGFREAGLHLLMLVSPTVVLRGQLSQLPVKDDESVLLAAESEGTTAIIVGRKQGAIFLERSLHRSWNKVPERVVTEVNRSILFVRQQFGAEINSLWLFGPGAEKHQELTEPDAQVPVQVSPVPFTPFYWAEQAVKLAPELSANLISKAQRNAPRRRILARITAFLVVGLLVVPSIGLSAWIELKVRAGLNAFEKLKPKAVQLQAEKEDLQKRMVEVVGKKQLNDLIDEQKLSPIPGWFLGYVADILPDELLLTELQVKRIDDLSGATDTKRQSGSRARTGSKPGKSDAPEVPPGGLWSVRLVGYGKVTEEAGPSNVLEAFERLTNKLTTGPYHLKITDRVSPPPQVAKTTGWTVTERALQGGAKQTGAESRHAFIINGVMR